MELPMKFWINKIRISLFIALGLFGLCLSCKQDKPIKNNPPVIETTKEEITPPDFNSDSAYYYIEKQVAFGPRVPGTATHLICKNWLAYKLSTYCDEVMVQEAKVTAYNDKKLPMYNIIGSFNTDKKKRLLLAAHWDTRPFADQDSEKKKEPILGANDGASGVGVLIEIARQLSLSRPAIGIDIILFDVEDYGQPSFDSGNKQDTYCLGSQYWSKQPHTPNYRANNGILLDMVGAKDAIFTLEKHSMIYADKFMRNVWDHAIQLGHSKYFSFEKTTPVIDDHYYINKIIGIPTIDIIQYDHSTRTGFGAYWHTHDDNMDVIDKNTLNAVGQTVLYTIKEF